MMSLWPTQHDISYVLQRVAASLGPIKQANFDLASQPELLFTQKMSDSFLTDPSFLHGLDVITSNLLHGGTIVPQMQGRDCLSPQPCNLEEC